MRRIENFSVLTYQIQLPEPTSGLFSDRIEAQDSYLRAHVGPWLQELDSPDGPLGRAESFHFMRYVNPSHLRLKGIVLVIRFLGAVEDVEAIKKDINATLKSQELNGEVVEFISEQIGTWNCGNVYGGSGFNREFATFLDASSRATLKLLLGQQQKPQTPASVAEQWRHCFDLISTGRG